MTSCGLNGVPLEERGEYPAYLACNLFTEKHSLYVGEANAPRVMQDGRDGDEEVPSSCTTLPGRQPACVRVVQSDAKSFAAQYTHTDLISGSLNLLLNVRNAETMWRAKQVFSVCSLKNKSPVPAAAK